ncbi:hypothetical protein ASD46_15760 [Rhizobium sp. Root491]|uniref:response regulator n=1 Tax=Rhizobium sp. Root491 TaxID=1736548 RepID=UPI00071456D4|nr:response regulator [Rhizobium sp. Root491]KQY41768.1 hypothetical protein ASD46_15760 [Rhizobium sp. Root491]
MAKVLIVEDDTFKYGEMLRAIAGCCDVTEVISALSVGEAVAALAEAEFDCILLDIALPSHGLKKGEGAPHSFPSGGVEVLLELDYLGRKDNVIIVTQYPELELEGKLYPLGRVKKRVSELMRVNLAGVVQFDRLSEGWKKDLDTLLRRIL